MRNNKASGLTPYNAETKGQSKYGSMYALFELGSK